MMSKLPYTEGVRRNRDAKPVVALGERLERRGRGVDPVVTHVGLGLEPERLPVDEDLAAERVGRGVGRVGGAEHLAAEVRPRAVGLGPLDHLKKGKKKGEKDNEGGKGSR